MVRRRLQGTVGLLSARRLGIVLCMGFLHIIHTNACIIKLSFTSQEIQVTLNTNACIAKAPSASQETRDHCVNGAWRWNFEFLPKTIIRLKSGYDGRTFGESAEWLRAVQLQTIATHPIFIVPKRRTSCLHRSLEKYLKGWVRGGVLNTTSPAIFWQWSHVGHPYYSWWW